MYLQSSLTMWLSVGGKQITLSVQRLGEVQLAEKIRYIIKIHTKAVNFMLQYHFDSFISLSHEFLTQPTAMMMFGLKSHRRLGSNSRPTVYTF